MKFILCLIFIGDREPIFNMKAVILIFIVACSITSISTMSPRLPAINNLTEYLPKMIISGKISTVDNEASAQKSIVALGR